jgi:hypothetical protein
VSHKIDSMLSYVVDDDLPSFRRCFLEVFFDCASEVGNEDGDRVAVHARSLCPFLDILLGGRDDF